jgi:hypothetical protein
MRPPETAEAELARQVRAALAEADTPMAPAFERMWGADSTPRVRWVLRWQAVAALLPVLAAAGWLLRASWLPPISDQQLRGLSAATEQQVWRDPFGGLAARIPDGAAGQHIQWPRVQYPLVPEQRYL